ncbi:hypothetical protein [Colwellia sp. MEBiC06753]
MKQELCKAIENVSLIELRYSGYSRTVEPYAYGRDKKGDEILRCYQISGGSKSGERAGWKLLKVREIYSLHPTSSPFEIRREYKRGDSAMEYIFCQQ